MANIFRGFANQTQWAIKAVSDGIISDPIVLFQVVAGGERLWRTTFMREFRGNKLVTDDIADLLFRGFCEHVVNVHGGMDAAQTATLALDSYEPITPPTDREIEDAWEVDSASSEDGRRAMYGDLHPQEYIKRLTH